MYIECYLQEKHHKSYIKKNNFLQWSNEFQELKDNRAKNNTLMIWFWELDSYCLRYKSHISDSLQVSWKLICLLEKVMLQVQYTSSRNSFLFQMNGEHCNQNLLLFPSYWSLTDLFLFTQSGKLAKVESDKPKRAPTAYFIFLAEFRKEMQGKKTDSDQKIPALAGEKWRTMTDKDKEKYKQLEAVAKKKHEAAMEEWRKKVSGKMEGNIES